MRKIVHISDIHFGAEAEDVPEILLSDIESLSPDLVVVSGDLTQFARSVEFRAAGDFLRKIRFPKLVVPGNHDLPFFPIYKRLASPFSRYRKYITDNLHPVFRDDELFVVGIATPRKFRSVRGAVSVGQRTYLRTKLCEVSDDCFKVVVTHHPFIPPPFPLKPSLIHRGILTLEEIRDCGADLLLAGHLHRGYVRDVKSYYPALPRSIIIAQAGTATSYRRRGESNSYNVITVEGKSFTVTARLLRDGVFVNFKSVSYLESERQWTKGDTILHP